MKKRIISLILVLVMLCLALASCGAYSLADQDLSSYATFSEESKAKFAEALKNLVIKDGDFTTDPATRDNKVWDSIYNDLASAVTEEADKLTTGVPADNDIIYYNYYYTAEFDGVTVYFTSNMKSESVAGSVQLGLRAPDALEKQLVDLFKGVDIKDYIYKAETSSTKEVKENDVVFISYTCSYTVEVKDETTGETAKKTETVNVVNERLVLTKGASALVDHLLEAKTKINTTIDKYEDTAGEKTYTNIKINWRGEGKELGTAKDVTYTEKREVTDTNGKSRNLKDKELTYHIYPINFADVPEFNELNFVNVILDDSITFKAITRVLFGEKFEEKTDEEKKAILDLYVTKDKDKDGKEIDVSFEDFIKSIATAQKEYASSLEAKEKAEGEVTSKQATYDSAKKEYDKKPDDADLEAALSTADANLKTAKKSLETATNTYNDKLKVRNDKVNLLLETVKKNEDKANGRNNLTDGYYTLTYEFLRDRYNEEVRMNLAEEVYKLFEKFVEVKDDNLPEKAVETTFDRLMENYEHDFYNGDYTTSPQKSNYAQFKGDFKEFLKEEITVSESITTSISYDDALAAVEQNAKDYIKPIIRIYVLSDAYGVRVTDEEFEAYKEKEDGTYNSDAYNYGENSVLYAFQFDKLMNEILKYEKVEDAIGAYKYNDKIAFTFSTEDGE